MREAIRTRLRAPRDDSVAGVEAMPIAPFRTSPQLLYSARSDGSRLSASLSSLFE
jgi:hypothetical protein